LRERDCEAGEGKGDANHDDRRGDRILIAHRNNKKILEQVKEPVEFGKFEPVVARDREVSAKPFLHNLMDEMRGCVTAVIHVDADGLLFDADRRPGISGDVLIEMVAAMALYGRNFVLLVEEGVELPSNLQALCECRYSGDELNMPATMMLLRAFNGFTQSQFCSLSTGGAAGRGLARDIGAGRCGGGETLVSGTGPAGHCGCGSFPDLASVAAGARVGSWRDNRGGAFIEKSDCLAQALQVDLLRS
jgi:hypothetical protein